MTVAAGFLCKDGLILCADSQETVSGYIKTETQKVITLFGPTYTMSITGSGTTDYIAKAIEEIMTGLPDFRGMLEFKSIIETRLLDFFKTCLAPWAEFGEHERPTVELLIGLTFPRANAFWLFHYSGTSTIQCHKSKAIGAGILLANTLLSEHPWEQYTIEEASKIAAYVMWKVKKQVDTCGGFTDMVMLKGGRGGFVSSAKIEELERGYGQLEKEANRTLTGLIVKDKNDLPCEWITHLSDALKE